MTYKNALAGINSGGGKSVIIGDPQTDKSPMLFKAMGSAIESLGGVTLWQRIPVPHRAIWRLWPRAHLMLPVLKVKLTAVTPHQHGPWCVLKHLRGC